MKTSKSTPLAAAALGAVAGAAGTLAMDLVWYGRYRRGGGESEFSEWEFSSNTEGYDQAGAPAKVGNRIVEGLFDTQLPPHTAGFTNNVVHWLTGAMWGSLHGLLAGPAVRRSFALGPATGVTAWLTSYAVLAPAGLYQPIWEYEPETLWKDASAHLVFGTVTAVAYGLLARRGAA